MKRTSQLAAVFALLIAIGLPSSTATAQGTAFTYQGQLSANGGPANGNYDFTFALFNTNSTNTGQIGATLTDLDVGVINGLFIVTLDFGANFPGASRWLSIGVRTNDAATFTALNPLQELTPTPYAIYTPNAGNAATATSATSAATATAASNVANGIVITNAVITNSVFEGNGSGLTNLSASQLSSIGNTNVGAFGNFFIGSAGNGNTSGNQNTAVGGGSLSANTSGSGNTAVGSAALLDNTSGSDNTAMGTDVLAENTTGSGNTAVGFLVLNYNTNGSDNTGTGYYALIQNISGSGNTANGYQTLENNTAGNNNTAVGSGALDSLGNNNYGGSNNIGLGYNAGSAYNANESSNIDIGNVGSPGENNIIRIGSNQTTAYIAGVITGNGGGLTNLSAAQLTSIGNTNPPAIGNFFVGLAGNATTLGQYNTVIGQGSLEANTTGNDNTAVGSAALQTNTTGMANTAFGFVALRYNSTGSENTAIGSGALSELGNANNAGGTYNIALGYNAGSAYTANESSNIDIGNLGSAGDQNIIRIGTNQTNTFIAGVINGNGVGLTNLSASQLTSIGNTNGLFAENNFFIGPSGNATMSGGENTALGENALADNTSGFGNTANGTVALEGNTSGSYNTADGFNTLWLNTVGNNNTATGYGTLTYNRAGNNNTAIGYGALTALAETTAVGGTNNIALGYNAGSAYTADESSNIDIGNVGSLGENNIIRIGSNQTTAYIAGVINGNGGGLTNLSASQLTSIGNTNGLFAENNFFIGPSGNATMSGGENTALGENALADNTSGFGNTANGTVALEGNTSGSYNTADGFNTLWLNTVGNNNTATGYGTLTYNRAGNNNTAIGYGALTALAETTAVGGTNNIALGYNAGSAYTADESSNIDIGNVGSLGENNIIRIGSNQTTAYIAGVINGNGGGLTNLTAANITPGGILPAISGANLTNLNASQLTSIGNSDDGSGNFFLGSGGNSTTSGSFNTAGGFNALAENTIGGDNTAYGSGVLHFNTNGSDNTAYGYNALHSNLTGSNNTATGAGALSANTTGSNNIAIGFDAGANLSATSSNIDIGNLGSAGDQNTIRIGTNQTATYIAGISGVTAASGVEVFVNPSGQLGTATSSARFKKDIQSMDDASDVLLALHPVKFKYKPELDPQGLPQFGLVAEEVDKIAPELVARDDKGKINTVRYNAVNAMLLNEFLKQHRKVQEQSEKLQSQDAEIQALQQKNDSLATRLNELEATVKLLAARP